MLALQPPTSRRRLTPNLLPAAIKHSGPVPVAPRHWTPVRDSHDDPTQADAAPPPQSSQSGTTPPAPTAGSAPGTSTVYFRGRRLRGRVVPVPSGYEGVVLARSERRVPAKAPTAEQLRRMEEDSLDGEDGEGMDMGPEQSLEVRLLEERGRFDEVVVWGHEMLPEPAEDIYVRGMTEWVGFAQAMMGPAGH